MACNRPMQGFLLIYGFCIVGSLADLALMALQWEPKSVAMPNMRLQNLLAPLREKKFRPILVYEVQGYISTMFSSGFLAVYQLNVLGLSHTFLTTTGIFCSVIGMVGIWFWGRVADRRYWTTVLLGTRLISAVCWFAWWLLPSGGAALCAPLIMALSAVGNGAAGMAGVNLQYDCSPPACKTAYLGLTAALASLMGYGSSLVGSCLQRQMEPWVGGRSIAMLFGISGLISLANWLYGWLFLPRAPIDFTKEDIL